MYEVNRKFLVAVSYLKEEGFQPVRQLKDVEIVGRAKPLGYSIPFLQESWLVRFPFLRMTNCVLVSTPATVLAWPREDGPFECDAEDLIQRFHSSPLRRITQRRAFGVTRTLLRHAESAVCFERLGGGCLLVTTNEDSCVDVSGHFVVTPVEATVSWRELSLRLVVSLFAILLMAAVYAFFLYKIYVFPDGEIFYAIVAIFATTAIIALSARANHVLSPVWEFFFRLRHKRPRYAHEADLLNEMKQQLVEELQAHGWEVVAEGYGAEMEQGPDGELKVLSEIRKRARGGTVAEEAEEKSDASQG